MKPEEVPAELVEAAAQHRWARHFRKYPEATWDAAPENVKERYRWSAADYLAAVLPLAQAAALRELATMMPADWQRPNGPADLARAHADHVLECRCAEEREGSPS